MRSGRVRRVLMTADSVGGVFNYAVDLCGALSRAGIETVLCTTGAPLRWHQRTRLLPLRHVEVIETSHRLEWMDDPWDDVEATDTLLLDLERRFAPDVVHLNAFCHGALPTRAPRLVVGHSCVLSWWRAVHGGEAPERWTTYRERVRQGLSGAHAVVAPSAAMLAALALHYGPLPRAGVIPNGIDPRTFPSQPKQPLVLGGGRAWDPAKGARTLAEAAVGLGWPVAIAGAVRADGVAGEPLPTGARLLGELSRDVLSAWLACASIFAHPAVYEPFGLLPLEAATAGCALVLGDIPSLREVWGDAAEYVPPGDAAALHEALARLIADPERRAEAAARARQHARRYGIAETAGAYCALYEELTAEPRTAAGAAP